MADICFAQAQHVAQLEALEQATYADEGYPAPLFYQALAQWPEGVIVCVDGQNVLGYLLAAPGQPNEHWIMSLLISEAARGQGIGNQLVQFYLAQVARQKSRPARVKLTVAPDNKPAIALYERNGFKKIDYLPKFMGPNADRILMEWLVN